MKKKTKSKQPTEPMGIPTELVLPRSIWCTLGIHRWNFWRCIEVETWKSFLPEQSSAYGMYMARDYTGPAGQFIKHNMQQRSCTKCGKIQRENV